MNGPLVLSVGLVGRRRRPTTRRWRSSSTSCAPDADVAFANDAIVNAGGDAAVDHRDPQVRAAGRGHRRPRPPHPAATSCRASTAIDTYVGGMTATFIDLSDQVAERMPWFIGAIVGLSFLLLVVVFRSILVPLKAAVMNLLSIGAAYGVVVAVFQWGWAKDLIGLESTVPIVSFVPMFMFAILFGLSMDYEVFLLSRVREEYLRSGDNTQQRHDGHRHHRPGDRLGGAHHDLGLLRLRPRHDPIVKMIGLGLAVAVFLDATIVRVVLVPGHA